MNPLSIPTIDLPLTEATFWILLCLAPEPKHGYAIMKEVSQLSEGRVSFSTGTLYGALKRLLELGWVTRSPSTDEPVAETISGRTRKTYILSAAGRATLQAEIARMENHIRQARAILGNEVSL